MEALKRTGYAISEIGERKLKGLENSEFIYLIYPNQLIGRLHMDRLKNKSAAAVPNAAEGSQAPIVPGPERIIISNDVRVIPLGDVRLLHMLAYRIEKLCSTNMVSEDSDVLQQRRAHNLREEDSDDVIIQAVESLVTRIEVLAFKSKLTGECCHTIISEALCLPSVDARNCLGRRRYNQGFRDVCEESARTKIQVVRIKEVATIQHISRREV
jgi:hypothetical protein